MREIKTVEDLVEECKDYIKELKTHCVDCMFGREYSWRAKYPFKVMWFVNAMTWRIYDMANAALTLMKQDSTIPSLCLVRACWENMVITYELKNLVQDCCEKRTIADNVDVTLMRLLFSNRFDKDDRYVSAEHYEISKPYKAKNILTLVQKLEKDFPPVKDFYSTICEFVHPNYDGVCGSYSHLDEGSQTVSFYPKFGRNSQLFPAFITTLTCSMDLFLRFIASIKENMADFTRLCENTLNSKTDLEYKHAMSSNNS